jgi:predicted enzyme related to lactoylglutathione lyase
MANHIAHFEIFASDVERARAFYEQAFGWRFEIGGPPGFYLIVTGSPAERGLSRGLIAKRPGPPAEGALNAFRCTISVSSIKEAVEAIKSAGGTVRTAVIEIPSVGKLVEFADTEGNIVCAMQYEANLPNG